MNFAFGPRLVVQPTRVEPSRDSRLGTAPLSGVREGVAEMTHVVPYDSASFAAGQDCGTRVAVCVARLSALELIDGSRWWNRWAHRRMAAALVAYAEELESDADVHAASAEASGRWLPLVPERGRTFSLIR